MNATPRHPVGQTSAPNGIVRNQPAGGLSAMGTVGTFLKRGTCSEALITVLDRAFGHPALTEEHATLPLAGGIAQHGYQCGQIWGAALAAGAESFRRFGAGPQAEARAIVAARGIVASFQAQNHGHMNCLEITDIDQSSSTLKMITYFLIKGGTIGCLRRAARYAPIALGEVNAAFAGEDVEVPPGPVSCSALLARKMGASDRQAIMAAGLAGGIGLSGGACGALGAAIWFAGIGILEAGAGKIGFKAPHAQDLVERFIRSSDYEFECAKIAGRKFAGVSDHADYLRGGGCAGIIEAMAAH